MTATTSLVRFYQSLDDEARWAWRGLAPLLRDMEICLHSVSRGHAREYTGLVVLKGGSGRERIAPPRYDLPRVIRPDRMGVDVAAAWMAVGR